MSVAEVYGPCQFCFQHKWEHEQLAHEGDCVERLKLRDKFAEASITGSICPYDNLEDTDHAALSEAAYKLADAMLKARRVVTNEQD
jgi:cellulose biosynthesis protein BcsQ